MAALGLHGSRHWRRCTDLLGEVPSTGLRPFEPNRTEPRRFRGTVRAGRCGVWGVTRCSFGKQDPLFKSSVMVRTISGELTLLEEDNILLFVTASV